MSRDEQERAKVTEATLSSDAERDVRARLYHDSGVLRLVECNGPHLDEVEVDAASLLGFLSAHHDGTAQARAIVAAAIAHVSDFGYCQGADEFGDDPYCDDPECTYCTLARAMEGYEPGADQPPRDPLAATRACAACGRQTRITTAGCDHCDVEDK